MKSAFPELAARLTSLGARPVADVTLEYVVRRHAATGGAVLALTSNGETVPFITRDVPTDRLAGAQKLWRDNETALGAGQEVQGRDCFLVPIADAEGQLLGLLFLDGPRVIVGSLEDFLVAFAHCLIARTADPSPALSGYLGLLTPTSEAREREHLLLSLNRNEWNISRVARDMGVTRRTIYLRLQRHGIERRKVDKSVRGRSGEPSPVP
jgi:hypothetical protein